jgi:uncharacterized protein YutE (UPF0331/DUF86 family)
MYYVDRQQIEERLQFIPNIIEALATLEENDAATEPHNLLHMLALERAVHLAIETVTDIGSLLIDGFLMRDASSYEDIINILHGEQVFPQTVAVPLLDLVKWRKPLVQDYVHLDREKLAGLVNLLPGVLAAFIECVHNYLRKEL